MKMNWFLDWPSPRPTTFWQGFWHGGFWGAVVGLPAFGVFLLLR